MLSFRSELIWLLPAVIFGSYTLRHIFLAELPPERKIANFVNAEDLDLSPSSSVTAGGLQDTTNIFPGVFVNNGFVYYPTHHLDDRLIFELPIETPGTYDLRLHFVKNGDFGVVSVSAGGSLLNRSVDLFAQALTAADPLVLKGLSLSPGDTLELKVKGKNRDALHPFYQIGLDGIVLSPAK